MEKQMYSIVPPESNALAYARSAFVEPYTQFEGYGTEALENSG